MSVGKMSNGNWAVNGTPIYIPATPVKIEHNNVVGPNSGRTEDGVEHTDWVRHDVVKVYLTWKALTGNEVEFLKNLISNQDISFTYWDFGSRHTISAYGGPMSYGIYTDTLHASEGGLYTDIAVNVIEN